MFCTKAIKNNAGDVKNETKNLCDQADLPKKKKPKVLDYRLKNYSNKKQKQKKL